MKRSYKHEEQDTTHTENTKIKSIKYYDDDDENEDKENMGNQNVFAPLKLTINVPKTKQDIFKMYNADIDKGYDTDETIPEEMYISPQNYKSPEKSSYERYLEMTDISRRNIPDGYETDDTVIMDENYDNEDEKMGGKYKRRYTKTKKMHKKRRTHKRLHQYKNKSIKIRSKTRTKSIKLKRRKHKYMR